MMLFESAICTVHTHADKIKQNLKNHGTSSARVRDAAAIAGAGVAVATPAIQCTCCFSKHH
jgi:hypothetical protein